MAVPAVASEPPVPAAKSPPSSDANAVELIWKSLKTKKLFSVTSIAISHEYIKHFMLFLVEDMLNNIGESLIVKKEFFNFAKIGTNL